MKKYFSTIENPTPEKSFNQDKIPWDKINCSYWWHFVPDHDHKKWFKPISDGNGYSKKQGHDEMKDKNMLLISKIIMLCTKDYITSCKSVEIFKRPIIKAMNNTDDQIIVTFFNRGKQIIWNNYIHTNMPKDIVAHLMNIGEMIKTGNISGLQYYMPRKKPEAILVQKNEDRNILNFRTADHVQSWAEYQIKNKGADFKTISEFADVYIKKYFPNYK